MHVADPPQRCRQAPTLRALSAENAPLLLHGTASEDIEGSCGELAEMEEGGHADPPVEEQRSVQELIWTAPAEAAHLLDTLGCAKLGSFRVQASQQGTFSEHFAHERGDTGGQVPVKKVLCSARQAQRERRVRLAQDTTLMRLLARDEVLTLGRGRAQHRLGGHLAPRAGQGRPQLLTGPRVRVLPAC